jgi:hypothetical protein
MWTSTAGSTAPMNPFDDFGWLWLALAGVGF